MIDQTKACWLCEHWHVEKRMCTVDPVWIGTTPEHYCGQFKKERVEFRDLDEINEQQRILDDCTW
jgi:hypothetical protein